MADSRCRAAKHAGQRWRNDRETALGELQVVPLPGGLGAEIHGVDLRDGVPAGQLRDAIDRHALLVIPGQSLDTAALVAVSRSLGDVVVHQVTEYFAPGHPEVMVLSNDREDGKPVGAPNNGIFWHSDQIFRRAPVSYTLLYGHIVPPVGGDTLFADMRAVCDALPADLRAALRGRRSVHSFAASYRKNYIEAAPLTGERLAANPDIDHPVLRAHPRTGRLAVFVDPDSTTHILDLPTDESDAILAQLFAFLDKPAYVYRHRWRAGDLVVWDNRCLLHRATSYDEDRHRRLMWRTQIAGDVPC
jgi:taurine dioxygenase